MKQFRVDIEYFSNDYLKGSRRRECIIKMEYVASKYPDCATSTGPGTIRRHSSLFYPIEKISGLCLKMSNDPLESIRWSHWNPRMIKYHFLVCTAIPRFQVTPTANVIGYVWGFGNDLYVQTAAECALICMNHPSCKSAEYIAPSVFATTKPVCALSQDTITNPCPAAANLTSVVANVPADGTVHLHCFRCGNEWQKWMKRKNKT